MHVNDNMAVAEPTPTHATPLHAECFREIGTEREEAVAKKGYTTNNNDDDDKE